MAKRLDSPSDVLTPYSDLSVRSISSGKAVPALRAKTQHRPFPQPGFKIHTTCGERGISPDRWGISRAKLSQSAFAVRRAAFCCRKDTGSASNASVRLRIRHRDFSRIPAGSVANCCLIHGASSRENRGHSHVKIFVLIHKPSCVTFVSRA